VLSPVASPSSPPSLASIGVYVGRFIRFNSWDALPHPISVAEVIHEELTAVPARTTAALLVLSGFLFVGYLVVYSFTELERDQDY
jgi:uncharacterized membrane protein